MIKTGLLKLLKGSGKYIGANIFWQWIALLFQIAAVLAAGNMILTRRAFSHNVKYFSHNVSGRGYTSACSFTTLIVSLFSPQRP